MELKLGLLNKEGAKKFGIGYAYSDSVNGKFDCILINMHRNNTYKKFLTSLGHEMTHCFLMNITGMFNGFNKPLEVKALIEEIRNTNEFTRLVNRIEKGVAKDFDRYYNYGPYLEFPKEGLNEETLADIIGNLLFLFKTEGNEKALYFINKLAYITKQSFSETFIVRWIFKVQVIREDFKTYSFRDCLHLPIQEDGYKVSDTVGISTYETPVPYNLQYLYEYLKDNFHTEVIKV